MTTDDMIKKLRRMGGKRTDILNRQDALFLLDVAERLHEQAERIAIMQEPAAATAEQLRFAEAAHVMTYEEIRDAPDHAVLWEEVRIVWSERSCEIANYNGIQPGDVEIQIAPVEKVGGELCGSGTTTRIRPEMIDKTGEDIIRYWSERPTDAQREAAPWQ